MAKKKSEEIILKVLNGFYDKHTGEFVEKDKTVTVTSERLEEMKKFDRFSEYLEKVK